MDILVQPPELRKISEQLRSSAQKIGSALQAIDNDIHSLNGDKFLGSRSDKVQAHYAPKREALLKAKTIILHFANDLQLIAVRFEQADKSNHGVNSIGNTKWGLDHGMEFKGKKGKLYKKGRGDNSDIQHDDINQGKFGDCYLLSSLAAIAIKDPNLIKKLIKDNGDGTYTVQFYEDGLPVYITVDAELPVEKNLCFSSEKGAFSSDSGELWPSIIEKAYAKWQGGYEVIGRGAPASVGLEALTGINTTEFVVGSEENIQDKIRQAYNAGDPIVVSTVGFGDTPDPVNPNLVAGHGYAVEKIEGDVIYLYNPWGHTHATINIYDLDKNVAGFSVVNMDEVADFSTLA